MTLPNGIHFEIVIWTFWLAGARMELCNYTRLQPKVLLSAVPKETHSYGALCGAPYGVMDTNAVLRPVTVQRHVGVVVRSRRAAWRVVVWCGRRPHGDRIAPEWQHMHMGALRNHAAMTAKCVSCAYGTRVVF